MAASFYKSLFLILAVSTGCSHLSPEPGLDDWATFEGRIAHWFEQAYGRANNMRFEPSSIAYPIGSIVRQGTQSMLTADCSYGAAVPQPVDGPSLPKIYSNRTIDANVNANTYAAKLLGQGSTLGLGIKAGPTLEVQMLDPKISILAEDQTTSVLRNPQCLSHLYGQHISIVRGYVEAKYAITSKTGGGGNGQVTIKSNDLVKLIVDATNGFTVEDVNPTKKLVILTDAVIAKEADPNSFQYLANGKATCRPRIVLKSSSSSSAPQDANCIDTSDTKLMGNNPDVDDMCKLHPEICAKNPKQKVM